MFDHFTFAAQPQTHLLDEAFPSPKDTSLPTVPRPQTSFPFHTNQNQCEINDIVAKLQQQTLQQRSRDELVKRFKAWRMESPNALEIDEEETESSEEGTDTASLPSTPTFTSVSCRRLQRQLNVQLQSCEIHVRDIGALVENMITSNSQCRVINVNRPFTPSTTLPEEGEMEVDPAEEFHETREEDVDEGYCEGVVDEDEETEMSLRRASAPTGVRKYNIRYGRSADVINIGGRVKVRNVPRMRRRRKEPGSGND
ncbi:hypothetical protein D0Z07_0114 [Hyphodiscus hymeniophilus]|uniref:Uncharacterized protein n=1 Tax=Hyphodiscus hymeniophilus TaxID=353542 RepID=A0A9P7B195_9HELO|nr:hypothetical protein D0Z07_0114 [Hyphodiscus hymeniophilus]